VTGAIQRGRRSQHGCALFEDHSTGGNARSGNTGCDYGCECHALCQERRIGGTGGRKRASCTVQQDTYISALVGHYQVWCAVVVKIGCSNGVGQRARRVPGLRIESTITIAQKHADIATAIVGRSEIKFRIPIKMRDRERGRIASGWKVVRVLEGAIAVSQKDADVVAAEVCNSNIQFAVAIKISHLYLIGIGSSAIRNSREKRASAIALVQQHAEIGPGRPTDISNHKIGLAVAVEVARGNGTGIRADGIVNTGLKRKENVTFA